MYVSENQLGFLSVCWVVAAAVVVGCECSWAPADQRLLLLLLLLLLLQLRGCRFEFGEGCG